MDSFHGMMIRQRSSNGATYSEPQMSHSPLPGNSTWHKEPYPHAHQAQNNKTMAVGYRPALPSQNFNSTQRNRAEHTYVGRWALHKCQSFR
jgi:hypothetical protein